MNRLGNEGAPWTIRTDLLGSTPQVISAGLSDDVEFEDCFLRHYTGRMLVLDPTPLSRNVAAELIGNHEEGAVTFVPDALDGEEGEQRYLAETDPVSGDPLYFYSEGSVPPRRAGNGESPTYTTVTVGSRTVQGLMNDFGWDQLDLLKLDIEGAEYAVIDSVLDSALPVRQIAVEFHHRFKGIGLSKTLRTVRKLREHGYQRAWVSDWGEEYLFVKTA